MNPIGRALAILLLIVAGVGLTAAPPATAGPPQLQQCQASKLKAAGRFQACLLTERAKQVLGRIPNFPRCTLIFGKAFQKAEDKAGAGVCFTEGDAAAVGDRIEGCFDNVQLALTGVPPPPCAAREFPATGQTTCWDSGGGVTACAGTGHDGDLQAGAALDYTDNGDGTITDNNTGLMWEKKSDDNSINDKDNAYTWDQAFDVHVAGLNGAAFAGYSDWRVPNVKELQTIVNYENQSPTVSGEFDSGCVPTCAPTTCSCTSSINYWTSTTFTPGPHQAWSVNFGAGNVNALGKGVAVGQRVRAVRGP